MNRQPRRHSAPNTASRKLFRVPGNLLGRLMQTPVLFLGLFITAAVFQISMMLTIGHAPAESLMPATKAPGPCVMFCHPAAAPIAAAEDATSPAQPSAVSPAVVKAAPIAAPAPTSGSCWMLCSPPATHSVDLALGSSPGWHMNL